MPTTEVSLNSIQEQIEVCDDITDLIDKIVPHMYKVRNQIKAQKNYINDVQRKLIGSGTSSIDGNKIGTLANVSFKPGIHLTCLTSPKCSCKSPLQYHSSSSSSLHQTHTDLSLLHEIKYLSDESHSTPFTSLSCPSNS